MKVNPPSIIESVKGISPKLESKVNVGSGFVNFLDLLLL